MEPLQILERYFNTFIVHDDPKDFFIGMADYLNYGDGIPEYDWITTQISSMPKAQMDKLDEQNKAALEKVQATHDEIAAYIKKKKINIPEVDNALRECKQIFDGHVHSSMPVPYMLHLRLYDIIRTLYALPDYKTYASKFIVFSEHDKTQPREYMPTKELDDLMETKNELERGSDDAIWGIQGHIYTLRDVVNKGREIGKGITARIKKQEPGATLDMLNFGVLMGEWMKVEEGRPERDPVFFVPKKVRPQVQRFHMHILANFPAARAALAQASPEQMPPQFDLDSSTLNIHGKAVLISKSKNSDAHYLLSIIFRDPKRTWAMDEIWEDTLFNRKNKRFNPKTDWRKIYNAAYAANGKVQKITTIKDFLDVTKTSVAVKRL